MPFLIVRNDITKMSVDAIVNAANNSLLGGGGVDGAIHRAAGPQLLEECRALGGCATGDAKITKGYNLPAKYVIHTVGPIWESGGYNKKELLTSCYRKSLELAKNAGCESVAFPIISAGAYGYPKDQALRVAIDAITGFLARNDMLVYIVIFDKESYKISEKLVSDIRQYIDDNYVDEHSDTECEHRRRIASSKAVSFREDLCEFGEVSADRYEMPMMSATVASAKPSRPLEEYLFNLDESFSEMLLRKISEKGMTDVQCYKKANIDRKLFSKIKNDKLYKPSKPTAIAFAIALELSLAETKEMLEKAGFALSHSSKFDIIIEYFIRKGNYNIFDINDALFEFDQPLLGC